MLEFGTIIANKYCLEEQVGEGGFGTVWRANQMDLDRPVAIKLVDPGPVRSALSAERMIKEAKVAAAVQQRNVVSILDVGMTEDRTPFLVMEFLQGESFGERLERKAMSVADIVRALTDGLRGLAAVHEAGIVHRDIKPENIFLVYDADGWFAKLLDFGISKTDPAKTADRSRSVITKEDGLVGTPQYMSPEQARGLPDLDARTDLFSMGVILYEALTGVLPFDGEDPVEMLIAVTKREPVPLAELRPELGAALSSFLIKAMSKAKDDRFQDARSMRIALGEAFAASSAGDAQGRARPPRSSHSTRDRPMSTPPPPAESIALDDALMGRPRERVAEVDSNVPPIVGATMLVTSGASQQMPRPPNRWRPVIVAAAGAAFLVMMVGGATWILGEPDPPTTDAPPTTVPVQDETPAVEVPEPRAEPVVEPVVEPLAEPLVEPEAEVVEPPAEVEPEPVVTRPRVRPRGTRPRPRRPARRRGGRVFSNPDF